MDVVLRLLLGICLASSAFTTAQSTDDGSNLVSSIYGGDSTTTASDISTALPTSANGSDNHNDDDHRDVGGLVNYYFVFLALFVIITGLGAFMMYRRKKRAMLMYRHGQSNALQQDVHQWDPTRARRRHWQGRWLSTDETHDDRERNEGLNEHGEAPPPYMPKGRNDEEALHDHAGQGLAVPLETLSREQAGLKPPGYEYAVTEQHGENMNTGATSSTTITSEEAHRMGSAPQYR